MSDAHTTLLMQVGGGVASVSLNRGYAMNALSPQLLEELAEALESLHERPDVQVVVLEGLGRAFSVGFDLRAMASLLNDDGTLDVDTVQRSAALGRRVIQAVLTQRAVTIASAHGFAVGGGFLLLAACDMRIATHDLVCSVPEVDLGLPLMWGGVPLLMRELGPGLARDLILTGRRFGCDVLTANHFIHRLVDEDARDKATGELVTTLLDKPKEALLQMKGQLQDASGIETPASMPDPERLQLCATHPAFIPTLMAYAQRLRG
ncbi:MAG: enoyl-CoA hydratase/isomerase family protein [Myxococcota bacterium]